MRLESVFLFSLVIRAFSGVNVKCNCSFDLYLLSPQVSTLVDYCRNERHSDLVDGAPYSSQCCPLYWRQAAGREEESTVSCSPGNLPEKASAAAAQTWPNSSGSKGNSWGSRGHRVHGNIVSTQSKELSGPCAAERLCCARPASPTCPGDPPGKSAEEGSADPCKCTCWFPEVGHVLRKGYDNTPM